MAACTRPTENSVSSDTAGTELATEPAAREAVRPKAFPDFVSNTDLPDSLRIDDDNVIYGDFNGDEKEDFAAIVTNVKNGFQGVLIIHNNDKPEYFVFGAGKEINGMKNLEWIDIFKTLPKGEVISPTLVDPETGDILGQDKANEFRLVGNGIFMHVDETEGGGILFWTGEKYNWYHLE